MPGPVSDAYDPEWCTRAKAEEIYNALHRMYDRVSTVLDGQDPIDIRELVTQQDERANKLPNAPLTEWEWRIIRFALERAQESI